MPAYPFISIFIAQYILYLTKYKITVSRIFYFLIGTIACLVGLITLFTVIIPAFDPVKLVSVFTTHEKTLGDINTMWHSFQSSKIIYGILLCVLIYATYILFKYLWKKNYLKALYATIGAYLAILLVLDGVFLPAFKDGISAKPFSKNLCANYPIKKDNLFVMNNLLEYSNMYTLNFYMHNRFRNFEKVEADDGYLLIGNESFQRVSERYGKKYNFIFLEEYKNKSRDGERVIQLYLFQSKM
jgi:hypothetical protein